MSRDQTPLSRRDFLAVASAAAGFAGLLQLMFVAFVGQASFWTPIFAVLSVLTMTLGNLVALRQRQTIRLLAYSGIAQSGYILLPFALVSLVVVGLIIGYHARSGRNPYLSITLGLLLGGALGNLLDRIRLGYVVDFVDAGIGSVRWYTFNLADAAISCAIVLLLAASLFPSVARRFGAEGRG